MEEPDETFVMPKVVGFATARGKRIKVSEASVAAAKRRLEEPALEEGVGFASTGRRPVTPASVVESRQKLNAQAEEVDVGFATARGVRITVSEASVDEAKRKLEEFAGNGEVGFSTAGGTRIKVSEVSVAEAKRKLEEPVEEGGVGFTTARGKPITVSDSSLADAKRKLEEPVEEGGVGFTTARGKPITVSDSSLADAKRKLVEFDGSHDVGFTTPRGIPVTMSGVSTVEAKRKLDEPAVDGGFGFSTARGKPIAVSEANVAEAKRKLDELVGDSDDGFAMSRGTPVGLSEASVSESKRRLEELEVALLGSDSNDSFPGLSLADCKEVEESCRIFYEDSINEADDGFEWSLMNNDCDMGSPQDRIASIKNGEKNLPEMKLVMARVYPLTYYSQEANGTHNAFLREKAFREYQLNDEIKKEKFRDQELPKVQEEVRKRYHGQTPDCPPSLWKNPESASATELVLALSKSGDSLDACFVNRLSTEKRKELEQAKTELEDKLRAAVSEELAKRMQIAFPRRSSVPVLKVRVMDVDMYNTGDRQGKSAVITIWKPSEELLNAVGEGAIFTFYSLKSRDVPIEADVELSTDRTSKIIPTSEYIVGSFRRKTSLIQEVLKPGFAPLFGEFDTVGIIVGIDSSLKGKEEIVMLEDEDGNTLKLKFFDSIESTGESIIQVGKVIACCNLQWRQSSPQMQMAFSQPLSTYSINVQSGHLLESFKALVEAHTAKQATLDVVKSFEDCTDCQSPLTENKTSDSPSNSRSLLKRKFLEQYDNPPPLPPIQMPAASKRGRVSGKFVTPRRVTRSSK